MIFIYSWIGNRRAPPQAVYFYLWACIFVLVARNFLALIPNCFVFEIDYVFSLGFQILVYSWNRIFCLTPLFGKVMYSPNSFTFVASKNQCKYSFPSPCNSCWKHNSICLAETISEQWSLNREQTYQQVRFHQYCLMKWSEHMILTLIVSFHNLASSLFISTKLNAKSGASIMQQKRWDWLRNVKEIKKEIALWEDNRELWQHERDKSNYLKYLWRWTLPKTCNHSPTTNNVSVQLLKWNENRILR